MGVVREPYGFVHQDRSALKDVYGGPDGQVFIECMRIRPATGAAGTVILFSHPIGGGAFLPLVTALAAAGLHVIYCNPRYRGNDSALIMEKCVLDLGACIRDLKKRFGYQQVILGGWSGGGSLALFYQEQAMHPTIAATPAGDPIDLAGAQLPAADAVMLLAAHVSRAVTLTEWIDPSILDEDQPFSRDPSLNIFDPSNPHQPPYDPVYVEQYRAAQIARNRRITARVRAALSELAAHGDARRERAFCVQGTMADLRWRDPSQDPSDRLPGTCYLGEPSLANDGPVGLARFTTLRSWLSQWSYDDSRANGIKNAANVHCPVLVINNTADLACTPSHAHRLYAALASSDKQYRDIAGADHYYIERPDLLPLAVREIMEWVNGHGF